MKRMRNLISFSIYLTLLLSFVTINANSLTQNPPKKKFKVVLDAGHGGKDHGKPSKTGSPEKDIALKIVLALGKELEKNKDVEVIYTRKKDVFIDLHERGKIANRAEADLFISVHCNAHTSQAYGAETYVLGLHRNGTNLDVAKAENSVVFLEENYEETYAQYDLNSPESAIGLELMQEEFLDQSVFLASLVQDNFRKKLKRKDRSVKQAGFIVLHQTVMPSVLIETGFITNTQERKYLNSSKGQQALANAIASAVTEYKSRVFSYLDNEAIANQEKEEKIEEVKSTVPDKIVEGVTFKVQLAASKTKLDTQPYNFKGLKEITRTKKDRLYKYYYGETSNYTEIQRKLEEAKAKGYSTAFIVSFEKNNIQVPLKQVLN
ncbi:N-acetylmuramoyl-L-alanine amidase [Dokdonia ponticola]|uniref:N-acetylmuramoyl-L-alanine amidase n=1 Tax=Dokdonia ponticola TaxID=2041041 RepID=A0ABV9HZT8_9FLAO